MGARDHSYECETCGLYRGGLNDLKCDCDPSVTNVECWQRLEALAHNLATVAALCRAYLVGVAQESHTKCRLADCATAWTPGCGRPA